MKKLAVFLSQLFFLSAFPQSTVGLISKSDGNYDGYILFAPLFSKTTYLIDKCGKQVHTWQSLRPPNQSVYLLPDGSLLKAENDSSGNSTDTEGEIQKLDWNSKVTWSYALTNKKQHQHHDIYPLPNGNILVLVCDIRDSVEAVLKGRNPQLLGKILWSEKILELKPKGKHSAEIVWEWKVWDHLVQEFDSTREDYGVVAENPQLININFLASKNKDWLHFNSIVYNEELDQILISNRNLCEIFIIDHSTSKKESASHAGGKSNKGGDLLYRWGNPASYNSGTKEDQKLFKQHHPHWIENGLQGEGKIMFFNNGLDRPEGAYSSVETITPKRDERGNYKLSDKKNYLPEKSDWVYTNENPTSFFSRNVSNAQRLSNGNTLICEGANGKFFEIDQNNKIVWEYVNPVSYEGILHDGATIKQNQVFRCTLYKLSYEGFKGRNLKAGESIELTPIDCENQRR